MTSSARQQAPPPARQQQQQQPSHTSNNSSSTSTSAAATMNNSGSGSMSSTTVYPEQLIGSYVIGETIGRGSFGKVKKGRHVHSGEPVAIKIINRQMLKSSHMDKKISREIKVLRLFAHPNICRLYEVISTPTDMYLIMEYVGGGELYDYIVQQGRIAEDEARYIFQQIVCAIEYCHHFRVVHRDLKPENILLGPGLQVKLIDFGLSNLMKDGEFLTTSCGSPNYAAPEVISGKLYIGPEADVWSCGVILYALLCGCLPFDEPTVQNLFSKIKLGVYPPPVGVAAGPCELIQKLLVVDPLVRLTVAQIRDHAWFNERLPVRLSYSAALLTTGEDRISAIVASETARKLKMREKDVRRALERRSGVAYVTYNILCDAKRRRAIAAEVRELGVAGGAADSVSSGGASVAAGGGGGVTTSSSSLTSYPAAGGGNNNNNNNSSSSSYGAAHESHAKSSAARSSVAHARERHNNNNAHHHHHHCASATSAYYHRNAAERELNMGLMLIQSPAMEVLLEHANAATNKAAYNTSAFLPASAHESRSLGASVHSNYSSSNRQQQQPQQQTRYSQSQTSRYAATGGSGSAYRQTPPQQPPYKASVCGTGGTSDSHASLPVGSFCMLRTNASLSSSSTTTTPQPPAHVLSSSLHSAYSGNCSITATTTATAGGGGGCGSPTPTHQQQQQQQQHRHASAHTARPYAQSYAVPARLHAQHASSSLQPPYARSPHSAQTAHAPRVGSVARKGLTYTEEEEHFIVANNCGWRIGLMTDWSMDRTLLVLYDVLRAYDMQWKVASPFSLVVRTTARSWSRLTRAPPTPVTTTTAAVHGSATQQQQAMSTAAAAASYEQSSAPIPVSSGNAGGRGMSALRGGAAAAAAARGHDRASTTPRAAAASPSSMSSMRGNGGGGAAVTATTTTTTTVTSTSTTALPAAAIVPASPVVFVVYLFRLHERRDEGYLLDVSVTRNSIVDLDVILRLCDELIRRIG